MHRWFRFCGMIALMGYATGGTFLAPLLQAQSAQSDQPGQPPTEEVEASAQETAKDTATENAPSPLPTPGKHQLRVSPLQLLQHRAEQQEKELKAQKKLLATLTLQMEEQKKAIEALKGQNDTLQTGISVLEGQTANLSDSLENLQQEQETKSAPPSSKRSENTFGRLIPTQLDAPGTPGVQSTPGSEEEGEYPVAQPKPPHTGPFHSVERGENLTRIAKKYGTTVDEILKLNEIQDERKLQIGQSLAIPGPATTTPTPAAPEQ